MTPDDPTAELGQNLARNLRWQRERRGYTQARLAELGGVPRSTLANLEVGVGNPTLSVLGRLSAALNVTLDELVGAARGLGRVYRRGELAEERRGLSGEVLIAKLLPDPIPGMEIDRMHLRPGARSKGVPHRPGTREYLYCERGAIVVWVAGERFDVSEGDVCAFRGDQRHSYHNEGDAPAVGFSVVTLAPSWVGGET